MIFNLKLGLENLLEMNNLMKNINQFSEKFVLVAKFSNHNVYS
jgi:hypothetical protein